MEETQKPGFDDRLGAAGVALFVGFPTAFVAWLAALLLGAYLHFHVSIYWGFALWVLLVISAFAYPLQIGEIFGRVWNWVLYLWAALSQVPP